MYSNRRSKASTKSSSNLRQNGGRKINSSSKSIASGHAERITCKHGCIESDLNEGDNAEFSEHSNLYGEQNIMYSASGTVTSGSAGSRMCRHSYVEGNMKGSKDSGIAEDEDIFSGTTMMCSASETGNTSPRDGGTIYHHETLLEDVNRSKDGSTTEHKHISSGQKVYSTLQTSNSSHGQSAMCKHGLVTAENLDIRDDDDNMSQESNEYESYNKGTLVKTVSYQNVTNLSQTVGKDFRIELDETEEEALKEELLHIFERERATLEMCFRSKMEERLRGFRSRQIEFEEATRAEKVELENNMSMEKMEMQKTFAEEIAKLTRSFNEERQQLEVYYKDKLKDLRAQLETEQIQVNERFAREKMELKEKLEAEYQSMIQKEISHEKQEAARQKTELEARLHKEKLELERSYNMRLTEAETSLQRLKAEFEANLTNEKMRMEKQNKDCMMEMDTKLHEERRLRHEKERELEQDKAKHFNEDSLTKKENERLKNDADALRREIDEKTRETLQLRSFEENVRRKGREGLEGKLKDDFEKLLADHKAELEKNYLRDKEKLDETLQAERRKVKEELDREKEKIKLEQDDVIRTKERLRSEEKTLTDRQQQQRVERESARPSVTDRGVSEWATSHFNDQRIELASGTKDGAIQEQEKGNSQIVRPAFNEQASGTTHAAYKGQQQHQYLYQQQQQQQRGSTAGPYASQPGTIGGNPQYVDTGSKLKGDAMWTSSQHTTIEYRQNQEQARNQTFIRETTAGSIHQSGKSDSSVYVLSQENERTLQSEIIALKSENEGLNAKIVVLKENIELHKKYKEEAKAEMERLLKVNQEYELKIHNLTLEAEKREKRNAEEVKAESHDHDVQGKPQLLEEGTTTADKNTWELEGKLRGSEVRATRAEKREKEYDAKVRLADERRKEKRKEDDSAGQWSVSRQMDKSRHEPMPTNDREDSHYKAKYEATLREKNKLLQATKDLQVKIKTLQEKQSEILMSSSHVEKSSEKTEETVRLEQLVSENSSLKQRTSELQNHLQRLLEKLKNEKEKAATIETKLSPHKSKSLHNIQDLQERLLHTGRELTGSRGDLDTEALRRIEKEIVTIGQIVKTQFGDGSMGYVSYRSANEDVARVTQLEMEKKELEMKLKMAREAMGEYVTLLNDKMQDVKNMTGMSDEMVQELHTRNNSLKKSLQDLEDGQMTSQLQNEQLRHQKAALQSLIGDLCRDEEAAGTSYNSSSRFSDYKHEGRSDEGLGTSYKTLPRYLDYKYKSKYGGSHDNRYDRQFERNNEEKYLSKEFKEMHDGETFSRDSRADHFSAEFLSYPSGYESFEYQDFRRIGSLY